MRGTAVRFERFLPLAEPTRAQSDSGRRGPADYGTLLIFQTSIEPNAATMAVAPNSSG
jgi:hypothetical protein